MPIALLFILNYHKNMPKETPDLAPEQTAQPQEQNMGTFPVSDIEDISERKLSSIALKLQELFPEQSQRITEAVNTFLTDVHNELLEANEEVKEKGLPELDQKSLNAVELFYQLKAEKQIRSCLPLEIKRTSLQYFREISGVVEKMEKGEKNISELSNPLLRGTIFQKKDSRDET